MGASTRGGKRQTPREFKLNRSDLFSLRINPDQKDHKCDGNFPALAEMGGIRGLAYFLLSDCERGISLDESQMAKRRSTYGPNLLPKKELRPLWEHCLEQLEDFLLQVLLIAGLVSTILGSIESPSHGWYEGVAIWLACALVTGVGGYNNYKQEREFEELENRKEPPKCNVIRNGQDFNIPNAELLVGDICVLSAGALVPADGVWVGDLTTPDIFVDESTITGESEAKKKNFANPFLLSGTSVQSGEAHMLVTSVGTDSKSGEILADLVGETPQTPLQEKLDTLAIQIGYFGTGVAIALFIILVAFWFAEQERLKDCEPTTSSEPCDDAYTSTAWFKWVDYFIIAVTVIVVAVPEGLPLAVNVSLAYSMAQMFDDQILVKVLKACETMGNATHICSDKTGTLTQNVMTVTDLRLGNQTINENSSPLPTERKAYPEAVFSTLVTALACNSKVTPKSVDPETGVKYEHKGPPEKWAWDLNDSTQTEVGMIAFLLKDGYGVWNPEQRCAEDAGLDGLTIIRNKHPIVLSTPFASVNKYSAVVLMENGKYRRYFKGASERIINMCANGMTFGASGQEEKFDIDGAMAYKNQLENQAKRVLAICYKDYDQLAADPEIDGKKLAPPLPTDATFLAIMGIQDPLRPDSTDSVRTCQRAGIIVRMVTGDSYATAKAIAINCDILTNFHELDRKNRERDADGRFIIDAKEQFVLDGMEFEELHLHFPEDFKQIIPHVRVLARSLPYHKKILVQYLQGEGSNPDLDGVVGATGDGTNDAPALKAAAVGLAMESGTDVAKAAADIRILDDKFSSVVRAVMWGRCVYDNICKFVQFQLTVNIVALVLTLVSALAGVEEPPLKAVQLLWVNLIMDTMAALALGTEKPLPKLLERNPFTKSVSLIRPVMWRNLLSQSVLQLVLMFIFLFAPHLIFKDVCTDCTLEQYNDCEEPGSESCDYDAGCMIADTNTGCYPIHSRYHYTVIFNSFVWCQIWNEINSRKVARELNVFEGFFTNGIFVGVILFTAVLQALLVEYGGGFTQTTGLDAGAWLICIALGLTALPFGLAVRLVPAEKFMPNFYEAGERELDRDIVFANHTLTKEGYEQEYAFLTALRKE
jgi:magnesium-transporting ATPase (P-type)